jgi:hypothetical protein
MPAAPSLATATLLAVLVLGAASPARAGSIYFIGNSVTDTVNYAGLQALAASRGYSQPWGRQMIPGAPLQWLWDHPANGFTEAPFGYPTQALPHHRWDALSLQPFDRSLDSDVTHIERYLRLLFGDEHTEPTEAQTANRQNTRILIYARWPRRDRADRSGGPRDWETLWQRPYTGGDNTNETADFFRRLVTQLRAQTVAGVPLADRVAMVPVGHVMHALHRRMAAGEVPGLTGAFDLYVDGIHLSSVGSYLAACTYFTVLYRETPVGLPVPAAYGSIPDSLRDLIQETVWIAVQDEPLAGVIPFTSAKPPPTTSPYNGFNDPPPAPLQPSE